MKETQHFLIKSYNVLMHFQKDFEDGVFAPNVGTSW